MRSLTGKYLITILLINPGLSIRSQDIPDYVHVCLFHDYLISALVMNLSDSRICLSSDTLYPAREDSNAIYVTFFDGLLLVSLPDGSFRQTASLAVESLSDSSYITFRPVKPFLSFREYTGSVHIEAAAGYLQIINDTRFNDYLAGVVETEGGAGAPEEFIKAQAVLCRTFAIRNEGRHAAEGADFCDAVHCQAYHGISGGNGRIRNIIEQTSGMILADADSIPVVAAYHSNSGGYTRNSADVWLTAFPYLVSKPDPFSTGMRHAAWSREINIADWTKYLEQKGFLMNPQHDPGELAHFSRVPKLYYVVGNDSLMFSEIREDWDFPSDFFDMIYVKGNFRISGKGYGHGLGLSQEGAMNMAKQGYGFRSILDFYFPGTCVLDIKYCRQEHVITR